MAAKLFFAEVVEEQALGSFGYDWSFDRKRQGEEKAAERHVGQQSEQIEMILHYWF